MTPHSRSGRAARPVLISGGAGFIGTNLAHRLLSDGVPVLILDNLSRPGVAGRWPIGFLPFGRLRRIRLSATDVNRTWRKGAEISGPVAALMMSVCGRAALLEMLDGPGLSVLRQRAKTSNLT